MLSRSLQVTKTLSHFERSSLSLKQARTLATQLSETNPNIGKIYHSLLNQSESETPVKCNFATQVIDSFGENTSKKALLCIDNETDNTMEYTYSEMIQHSHQIGSFFRNQGLLQGEPVALMLGQQPAWWFSLAGLIRAGIPAVPCPRLLTEKDLLYRINDLGIKAIITTPEIQERIDSIRSQCPTLTTTITTGPASNRWFALEDIYASEAAKISVETTTDDPCVYLYTSGTTGQPKAVQHNADYPFFHWPTGRQWMRATPNDLVYNASDTGWGFTVWTTTAAWSMGAKILITPTKEKFSALQMLETLHNHPVTIFCAAPTVLRLLAANPEFDNISFPHLKRIVTVGEALDETVIERFSSRGIDVAVGFGQAETPLIMGRINEQDHVPGTMGKPIWPYKVVALDDNCKPLPADNIGQIAVDLEEGSAAGIMRGYANAPERTKKSRSPDGRYHLTGDWAHFRPDGLFSYQGRHDDLIKSRGYRIGPNEVEKAGMSHPAIAKIAVIGVRTQKDSYAVTVKAFVLLKSDYTNSPSLLESIRSHIKQETGPYKYPRLIECLSLEEWEKYETTSGKIRRAGLREREELKLELNAMPESDAETKTVSPQ